MQSAQIEPIIAIKCSGVLNPWIVIHDLGGILLATKAFAKAILYKKKSDHVYFTIFEFL